MSYESRRAIFRNYLMRSGVIDALARALKAVNKEPKKPENLIYFVRKALCESCPDDGKYDHMAIEVEVLNGLASEKEKELDRLLNRYIIKSFNLSDKSPTEVNELCKNGLKELQNDKGNQESLLLKFLTEAMIDEYCGVRTDEPFKITLYDICHLGFKRHDLKVNVMAPDAECFTKFGVLLDPIIKNTYGLPEDADVKQQSSSWGNLERFGNIDPDQRYVLQSYIMVSRNLANYRFSPKMTEEQFNNVEADILALTEKFKAEHKGRYFKLGDIEEKDKLNMAARGLFFDTDDERLRSGGAYRFWPTGRGAFSNFEENFVVYINWVDHLRVRSFARNGNLGDIYSRLVTGMSVLEDSLSFAYSENYGYLTPDLLSLGCGLDGVVVMAFPNLIASNPSGLIYKAQDIGLDVDNVDNAKGTCEIHLAPGLVLNEYYKMKILHDGCLYLIECEKANEILPYTPPPNSDVPASATGGDEQEAPDGQTEEPTAEGEA